MRRYARGVAAWTVLGLVLGGFGPGVASLFLGGQMVLFVLVSELLGVGGGVLLGLWDPSHRFISEGDSGPTLARGLGKSLLIIGSVGGLWAGSVGAASAFFAIILPELTSGVPGSVEGVAVICGMGAAMAVIAGVPGLLVFGIVRGLHASGRPRWWHLPAQLLGAGVMTGIMSIPAFAIVLGLVAGSSSF